MSGHEALCPFRTPGGRQCRVDHGLLAAHAPTFFALHALQHRGQESAGITVWGAAVDTLENTSCVIAEVYPSTVPSTPKPGEILDQAQVRTLSEHFEMLDSAGKLAEVFSPPNSLSGREIHNIEAEEGWILAK